MKTDSKKNSIYRALASLALGLVLLICPGFIAGSFVRIIGIIILIVGVVSILRFFNNRDNAILVGGIVEALAGLFLLIWPKAALKVVFAVLALVIIFFAVDHLLRIARRAGKWPLYILPSAMVVLGVTIFFQPVDAAKIVVILFGSALVAYSLSEVFTLYLAGKSEEVADKIESPDTEIVDGK